MINQRYKNALVDFLNSKNGQCLFASQLKDDFTEYLQQKEEKYLLCIHNIKRMGQTLASCEVIKLTRSNRGVRYYIGK